MGDHAVLLSKIWSRLPYLGKIVDMWTTLGGKMKVKINWLYHKDEVMMTFPMNAGNCWCEGVGHGCQRRTGRSCGSGGGCV